MMGPRVEPHEMKAFEEMLNNHILKSTLSSWIATRHEGGSASLCSEGNVSVALMRAFDKLAKKVEAHAKHPELTPYEHSKIRLAEFPEPEGQKFRCKSRVRISDYLGESMSHFSSGVDATVDHTYAHAFGGTDVKSYALDVDGKGFSAWYQEDQLTQIERGIFK